MSVIFIIVKKFSPGYFCIFGLQVCSPNEFDILLKMPGLRFELETCDVSGSCGAFYYIKMKRNPQKGNLNKFIEDDRLSSCLVLSELTKIIKEGVKETEGNYFLNIFCFFRNKTLVPLKSAEPKHK